MTEPRLKPGPVAEPIVFLDEVEEDDREPTKEELMDDLRIALRQAIAGECGIPALEGLAAIERRIYGDADHS